MSKQQDRRRRVVAPEIQFAYSLYGWVVEFGADCRSMILKDPEAVQFALKHRGTAKPLYERVEAPAEPELKPP